jgi:hypothetical protein
MFAPQENPMKKNPDETLKKFGMDPKTVLEERKAKVQKIHMALYQSVGQIVNRTLDLCDKHGFGNAAKVRVVQGTVEPGLVAMALSLTYRPDIDKIPGAGIPFDSVLFAALLCAGTTESVDGRPKICTEHAIEAAHQMFKQIRGKVFRDCFIDSCECQDCARRRKETGIKLDPEKMDAWL